MNLQAKDKKILNELEMNARISQTQLAKKVGLSKQVVNYRIENLEKEKIIQGYNAIIDLNTLGKTIYVVYLKLIKISTSEEQDWIEKIEKHKNVMATGKNFGEWDLTIVIQAKNNQELESTIKNLTKNREKQIKQKLITSEIESTYLKTKFFGESTKKFSTSKKQEEKNLDEKDLQILAELAKNCRKSLVELAEKVEMSANGVKNKIKNLEKEKIIIGYKTKINFEKLDFLHFRVFLHLQDSDEQDEEKIKKFLSNQANIESISKYLGYADLEFRCYAKNIIEFYTQISKIKDAFKEKILEINSVINFKWESINYFSD